MSRYDQPDAGTGTDDTRYDARPDDAADDPQDSVEALLTHAAVSMLAGAASLGACLSVVSTTKEADALVTLVYRASAVLDRLSARAAEVQRAQVDAEEGGTPWAV